MEQQTYELLKRYALGQMTEAERTDFEQRLETDAAFAAEIAAWAAVYRGIQAEGDRRLEEQLRDSGKKLMQAEMTESGSPAPSPPLKGRFGMLRWAYAAAAAILLLILAWPVYQSLRPSTAVYAGNKALFEQYFQLPPAPEVRDAQVTAWREAYQNKQYAAAVTELEKLLADPDYTRRSEASLYLGLSQLAAGQGQKALGAFQQVSPESFDHDDAEWYSALAYIIVDDVVHAKQSLERIVAKEGHPHRKEAQELLGTMK